MAKANNIKPKQHASKSEAVLGSMLLVSFKQYLNSMKSINKAVYFDKFDFIFIYYMYDATGISCVAILSNMITLRLDLQCLLVKLRSLIYNCSYGHRHPERPIGEQWPTIRRTEQNIFFIETYTYSILSYNTEIQIINVTVNRNIGEIYLNPDDKNTMKIIYYYYYYYFYYNYYYYYYYYYYYIVLHSLRE